MGGCGGGGGAGCGHAAIAVAKLSVTCVCSAFFSILGHRQASACTVFSKVTSFFLRCTVSSWDFGLRAVLTFVCFQANFFFGMIIIFGVLTDLPIHKPGCMLAAFCCALLGGFWLKDAEPFWLLNIRFHDHKCRKQDGLFHVFRMHTVARASMAKP